MPVAPCTPTAGQTGEHNSEGLLPPAAAGWGTGLAPACRTECEWRKRPTGRTAGWLPLPCIFILGSPQLLQAAESQAPSLRSGQWQRAWSVARWRWRSAGTGACSQKPSLSATDSSCSRQGLINQLRQIHHKLGVAILLGELEGAEGASSAALRCHTPHPVATVGLWRLRMRASTSGSAQ
jgi:hypothetical protein